MEKKSIQSYLRRYEIPQDGTGECKLFVGPQFLHYIWDELEGNGVTRVWKCSLGSPVLSTKHAASLSVVQLPGTKKKPKLSFVSKGTREHKTFLPKSFLYTNHKQVSIRNKICRIDSYNSRRFMCIQIDTQSDKSTQTFRRNRLQFSWFFLGNIAYKPQYVKKKSILITYGLDNLKSRDFSIDVCLFVYSAYCFADNHLTLTLI